MKYQCIESITQFKHIYPIHLQRSEALGQERNLPVKVGEEYDLEITESSKIGTDGVARLHGLVIFVKKGKLGQKVRVRIKSLGTTHAVSEIV
jgi:predicted RNA-binding protein with TRAM domain